MNYKMKAFLLSIGIEDPENFDMDFTLVAKDEYVVNKVNMSIEKESLWSYDLLNEFILALRNIKYEYSIRFFYPNCELTSKDVYDLLDNWYSKNFFAPIRFQTDYSDPSKLRIVYKSNDEQSANVMRIKEFKELLKTINYSMLVEQVIDPVMVESLKYADVRLGREKQYSFEMEDLSSEIEPEPKEVAANEEEVVNQDITEPVEEAPVAMDSPIEEVPEEPSEEQSEESTKESKPEQEEPQEELQEALFEAPKEEVEEAEEPKEEASSELVLEPVGDLFEEPSKEEPVEEPVQNNEPVESENPAILEENPQNPIQNQPSSKEEDELVPMDDDSDYEPEEEEVSADELIAKETKNSLKNSEEYLLQEMEANLKEWEEAQKRKAVFRRGDYEVADSIDAIYAMQGNHNVDFVGTIFSVDPRLTKRGSQMNRIAVYDDTNAISVTVFETAQLKANKVASLAPNTRVRIRGGLDEDRYSGQKIIACHYLNPLPPKALRDDPEEEKRVELHLHTKMSTMDGVCDMADYVKVAKNMGMTAIAVTDHGSLQSLPDCQTACDKAGLKPIYGFEAYLVDLAQKYISNPSTTPLKGAKYCVFDTETTGLVPRFDRLVEFGGLVVQNGIVLKQWQTYIDPKMKMSEGSSLVNHITDDMLVGKPLEAEVLPKILELFEGCILVAHNATFDMGFINAALERNGYPPLTNPVIDTLAISHYLFPEKAIHREEAMLKNLGVYTYSKEDAHEAIYDATKLNDGWQVILPILEERIPGIRHCDIDKLTIDPPNPELKESDPEKYQAQFRTFNSYVGHLREKHATVLVKNAEGLRSVNKIVSLGETDFLSGNPLLPRTPRYLLEKYRKDLLIGTACQNGEIFQMAQSESVETLAKAIEFYDFVEIQPLDCYSNLINMGEIRSEEQLKEILSSIIEAAKLAGKPVVATGDVHYCNPEDKIIRDIYITAKSIGNRNHPLWRPRRDNMPWFENPNQHFRSTREMLDAFIPWLGEEYAREIVIKNSNWVADQITTEPVPVSDETFTPNANLPNSEKILRDLCEKNFQDRYCGNPDPEVQKRIEEVHQRLLRELDGIIGNGYAVTYYIAHCLIKMAGEEPEHYIVGSRGSVGSSFAATMADITEVNALAPHYLCPKCHYFEWGDKKKYKSGFDLPDKTCPCCGEKLKADGQNIPFQTFLGFNAEKVPDIDLNFEDESQKKAHNYTKILLGADKVFRAGTIETVAEKTAFGFVKQFYRIKGVDENSVNPQWINYLASKVQGVKRTTGQHPGGIVVVPKEHDITDFTAYQHPADDINSEWLTTHYDYHAMHDELLKLDILGHVDPMAMRYYRDITGVPIESIPMNDPRVLSLFTSPNELKLRENFLGLKTGVSAIPEFGTHLAQQMLTVAQPKCFNDLLIISGLAHGTDVWSGNAEDLITSGTTDINGVIGCRDDIMTYLISQGIENGLAFKMMETIRKGKFSKSEEAFVPVMQAAHIPEWYIDSCRKIKYLFPRGHATAYVMMAVRVAWFKLYRPLEFYSVFFSIRSDAWDIKTMIEGENAIKTRYKELDARRMSRDNPLSNKESNILKTLQIALEMVERGFSFSPIDLYKSDGKMFIPDHEHNSLIPPFSVIDGLGVAAGNSIVEARKKGIHFYSKEDLLQNTKLSKTNVEGLIDIGGMEPLSDTNQMSLFEFLD
ncbi:MAG: PolC-type DNA polymerase III [Bacilli bacterium]|nr:PolC-type DNA polymerase III [Bacilli bacterium]